MTAGRSRDHGDDMRIGTGYELTFEVPGPTPMLLVLCLHPDVARARRG